MPYLIEGIIFLVLCCSFDLIFNLFFLLCCDSLTKLKFRHSFKERNGSCYSIIELEPTTHFDWLINIRRNDLNPEEKTNHKIEYNVKLMHENDVNSNRKQ